MTSPGPSGGARPLLAASGLLTAIDRAALAGYCASWGRGCGGRDGDQRRGMILRWKKGGYPYLNPQLGFNTAGTIEGVPGRVWYVWRPKQDQVDVPPPLSELEASAAAIRVTKKACARCGRLSRCSVCEVVELRGRQTVCWPPAAENGVVAERLSGGGPETERLRRCSRRPQTLEGHYILVTSLTIGQVSRLTKTARGGEA
jgi:hypothetical protein